MAYLDQINAHGGIDGHKLDVTKYDAGYQLGAHVAVVDPVFEPVGTFGENIDGELFAEDWASPYVKNNSGITAYLAAMKAAGYRSKAYTAGGILSKVSFPQFQHVGIHCLSVMKVVNGTWVAQTNGSHPFVCGAPSEATRGT